MAADWLFVDGSSLIFRAFYGVPQSVRAPDGHMVNAVRGFLDTLARLISSRQPRRVAVASDMDWRPAWRVALIAEYKAHRVAAPIPPPLIPQMPIIEQALNAIGIDFQGVAEYEAEDVISTWTTKAAGTVEIVSGDRDLFALVEGTRVVVLYPEKAGLALIDEHEVTRRYGIPGRNYADFAVLRGDTSDGLPGLRGVGPTAAAAFIRKHGGVAGLLRDGAVSEQTRDYLERAMRVVQPVRDLPIELPTGRRDTYPADPPRLDTLKAEHNLSGPADRLLKALIATSGCRA
jgi:5'-3' exonuclease